MEVSQLAEPRIGDPAVVGSSPIVHPNHHGGRAVNPVGRAADSKSAGPRFERHGSLLQAGPCEDMGKWMNSVGHAWRAVQSCGVTEPNTRRRRRRTARPLR